MESKKNPQKKNPHVPKNGTSKKKKNFFCEVCDYNTSNKKDFKKHFSTKKHGTKWYMKFNEKLPYFFCEECEYITCCLEEFRNHNLECQCQKIPKKNPQISKVQKTEKKKIKNESVENEVKITDKMDTILCDSSSNIINVANKNTPKNAKTLAKKKCQNFQEITKKVQKTEKKKIKNGTVEYEVENSISDEEYIDIYSSNVENGIYENDSKNTKTTAKKHQDFGEKTEKKKIKNENVEYEVEQVNNGEEYIHIYSSTVENHVNENDSENAKIMAKKVENIQQNFDEKMEKKNIKNGTVEHEVENIQKIVDNLILNQSNIIDYTKQTMSKNAKTVAKMNKNCENICNLCGKEYKYPQGLYRHRKKCEFINKSKDNDIHETSSLLDIVVKTQNQLIESQEQTRELCNEIIKLKDGNKIINNTYNQNVNINLFLNEECKDAMNLTDFLSKIQMTIADLAYTKNNGMIKGITNIVIKNLEDTPPTERPIHSIKDEDGSQLYIKEDNIWGSENEKSKIEKSIDTISKKQLTLMKEWEKHYPDWNKTDKGQEEYMEICRIVLGGTTESELEKTRDLILEKLPETNVVYGKDDQIE
tara:strand:- start:129 stop:1895 length:1767 start_codon:yes stop_codon:yes gene_type:complete